MDVENCTFDSNLYSFPDLSLYKFFNLNPKKKRRYIDYVGVSVIYIVSPVPKLRVHSSKFLNNRFLSDKGSLNTTDVDGPSMNSALINMEWSEDESYYSDLEVFASLEVTDSHFIGNTGYTSAIILGLENKNSSTLEFLSKNIENDFRRKIHYFVKDNIVMNNTPSENF